MTTTTPEPLGSLHTSNFPALLERLGISLAVTTYQAGKLVFLRADGPVLNTHFRTFPKPMGLALEGDRLALGSLSEVWEYHNNPTVAARREPAGRHGRAGGALRAARRARRHGTRQHRRRRSAAHVGRVGGLHADGSTSPKIH